MKQNQNLNFPLSFLSFSVIPANHSTESSSPSRRSSWRGTPKIVPTYRIPTTDRIPVENGDAMEGKVRHVCDLSAYWRTSSTGVIVGGAAGVQDIYVPCRNGKGDNKT